MSNATGNFSMSSWCEVNKWGMGIVEAHIISVPSHKVLLPGTFVLLIPVVAGELATPLHLGRHPSCCYYISYSLWME